MSRHRRRHAARRKQTKTPRGGGGCEERKSIRRAPQPEPAFDLPPPELASTTNEETIIPEGAVCYICLDDGPDEEGKPLVRDCSCRGDSAGFAHLSCLIDCAEHKSKDILCFGGKAETAWLVCSHCEQSYQNQLAKDMSRAFLSFAEKSHRERDYLKYRSAKKEEGASLSKQSSQNQLCKVTPSAFPSCAEKSQRELDRLQKSNGEKEQETSPSQNPWYSFLSQLRVMDAMKAYSGFHRTTGEDPLFPWMVGEDAVANRMLSIVEQLKKDVRMTDECLHMPKDSNGYAIYKILRGRYEAYAYCQLGKHSFCEGTDIGYRRAISYMERARIIAVMLGKEESAKSYESRIDLMKHLREGRSTDLLEVSKNTCQVGEEFSPLNINAGCVHAYVLEMHGKVAEAMALATKLATSSRRVNGPQHECTVHAEVLLKDLMETHGERGQKEA